MFFSNEYLELRIDFKIMRVNFTIEFQFLSVLVICNHDCRLLTGSIEYHNVCVLSLIVIWISLVLDIMCSIPIFVVQLRDYDYTNI